ncbi:hypothetical protein HNY73_020992 [Argiope bruennichi]|uniref:RRM domain-containing protein n=1 Tax=Argiope bruennichi TaxID=94029 RepID=A0A8T0EBC3_ARGBR|nr:hypothetical protein HNY73_020992 [Argiope bruennichi]
MKVSLLHSHDLATNSPKLLIAVDTPKKCTQEDLKKTAIQILKANGSKKRTSCAGKSTKDFKKAFRQNGEIHIGQKRCAKGEFTPESEAQPRSVIVRGQHLTSELLHKVFDCAGEIWKMRVHHNAQSAVITYRKSENALFAVNNLNNSIIEGKQLGVELAKKRNTAWSEISAAEAKSNKYDFKSREKRTIHVSYRGNLTMQDFRTIFRGVGRIEKIYLSSLNPASSSSKNPYAFVTFEYEDEARRALDEKDGEVFNGIRLKISPQKILLNDSSIPSVAFQEKDSRDIVAFDDELF